MKKYCLIINNVKEGEEVFKPITDAKLGETVWYQNGNGNWYRGTVVRELEMVKMPLVSPPNDEKLAITVDIGDIVLLLDKNQLFELS